MAADLDATATLEPDRKVAIVYVDAEGKISEKIITRASIPIRKPGRPNNQQKSLPHFKSTGLIPIWDWTHADVKERKQLFLYGIIRYNRDGDFENLLKVARG